MIAERRHQPRFLPVEYSFAALGRKYSRVGKIKDIGLGGLAFEYIVGENTSEEHRRVDIFMIRNVFHLPNIPCRVVYDKEIHVPHVNSRYVKALTTKRCGVLFGEINKEDFVQLNLFLNQRTTGQVSRCCGIAD